MLRRFFLSVVTLLTVLVWLVPSTAAAPADTETIVVKNVTETFAEVNPCTGAPGTVTVTYNAIFHITTLPNGTYHVTGTQTGRFRFVPDDPSLPTYTGRFTIWFGENSNQKNFTGTFTFSGTGKGSDGSRLRFSAVAHISVNANGTVTAEFDRFRCR